MLRETTSRGHLWARRRGALFSLVPLVWESNPKLCQPKTVCVLLLQDLLQSCARGGRRRMEDIGNCGVYLKKKTPEFGYKTRCLSSWCSEGTNKLKSGPIVS